MDIQIRETLDYEALKDLFVRSGLEVKPEDPAPEGLLTCLELLRQDNGERIGCIALQRLENADKGSVVYILRLMAVEEKYRGQGYGRILVERLLDIAKNRYNADSLWLTAKVAGFYKKFGFTVRPMDEAPYKTKCGTCPQYKNGCDSELMVLHF